MLIITFCVEAPLGQAIGIKEDLASFLEQFGDVQVVSITEKVPEQLRMADAYKNYKIGWVEKI